MPRKTKKSVSTEQVRESLVKGSNAVGDEIMNVRGDQLLAHAVDTIDEDLKKDCTEAGEGFLEVTGTEVLEALGEIEPTPPESDEEQSSSEAETPAEPEGQAEAATETKAETAADNEKKDDTAGSKSVDNGNSGARKSSRSSRKAVAGGDNGTGDQAG